MDNFYNEIKIRNNFFELPSTFEKTESELLNNSIFSKTWYLYNAEIYLIGRNSCNKESKTQKDNYVLNYITNDNESDYLGTYKIPSIYFKYIASDLGSYIETEIYEEGEDYNCKNPTKENAIKLDLYLKSNNAIISEDDGSYVDINMFEVLLAKEWKCFLYYQYFDGQHDAYWIINTNKSSSLFEYVFVYGSQNVAFFHFSEIDNNIHSIEQLCEDFDLLN